jgi:hypothetical protein
MDDLHSRAAAFLRGPCILGEQWRLIARYIAGEPWDDPEVRSLLSHGLRAAQTKAAGPEGATGPERDARLFYQRAAAILQDIQAEVSAGRD